MKRHLRVARPVLDLARSATMYAAGLGLEEIGRFEDHDGFDGVMLDAAGHDHHFEFTACRARPVEPSPTPEDLVVCYVPDTDDWRENCARMPAAEFAEVRPHNPY